MKLFAAKDKGEGGDSSTEALPSSEQPSKQPTIKVASETNAESATAQTDVEQPLPTRRTFQIKRRGSKDSDDAGDAIPTNTPRRASLKSNHSDDGAAGSTAAEGGTTAKLRILPKRSRSTDGSMETTTKSTTVRVPRKRSLSTEDGNTVLVDKKDRPSSPPSAPNKKNNDTTPVAGAGGTGETGETVASVSTNESPKQPLKAGSAHHHQRLASLLQTLSHPASTNFCARLAAWAGVLLLAGAFVTLVVSAWMLWRQTVAYHRNSSSNDEEDGSTNLDELRTSATLVLQHLTDTVVQQLNALRQMDQLLQDLVIQQQQQQQNDMLANPEIPSWCTTASSSAECFTWPFVLVPFWQDYYFATNSTSALAHSTQVVSLHPRVPEAQAPLWASYISQEERTWVERAYENDATASSAGTINDDNQYWQNGHTDWFVEEWQRVGVDASGLDQKADIFTLSEDSESLQMASSNLNGDFWPQWQVAPLSRVTHAQVNQNWREPDTLAGTNDNQAGFVSTTNLFQEDAEQLTQLVYPIFDEASSSVVARMIVEMSWQERFQMAISQVTESLVVELSNTDSAETVWYSLESDGVTLLPGPTNDTSFHHEWLVVQEETQWGQQIQGHPDFSGPTLALDQWNAWTLTIYPRQKEGGDDDLTEPNETLALVLSILAAALLVLCGVTGFWMYRRQSAFQKTATQADAIVSSLFPKEVKEQLYEQQKHQKDAALAHEQGSGDATLEVEDVEEGGVKSSADKKNGPPIAEYYDSATILFADLAGFTKWSSSKEPAQVFEFLERLYGGFDEAAQTHGVFKIETIGDCYVAVCGLPERCDDHAVRMIMFAKHMIQIFHKVQEELGARLQTQNLGLRTGIHSGSVTAGVLRGEKARFQLFGDSVNTTARHESLGKPGRIHISKQTAELLQTAGYREWIRPRKHKVTAKGKGQLETWWVNLPEDRERFSTEHESSFGRRRSFWGSFFGSNKK